MPSAISNIPLTGLFIFLTLLPVQLFAASAEELEITVDATIDIFNERIKGGREFLERSKGVLVFPNIVKAGFIVGGEYGEGAMRIRGRTVDYYRTAGASFGFQFGAQTKSLILVFLEDDALNEFRNSAGWEAGVDGSIAVADIGTGGSIDTTNYSEPIIAFVFGNKGLMLNITLEGTKYTRIQKD